jgi:hypothetical protein
VYKLCILQCESYFSARPFPKERNIFYCEIVKNITAIREFLFTENPTPSPLERATIKIVLALKFGERLLKKKSLAPTGK